MTTAVNTKGYIRFAIPDESIPATERAIYAPPASKEVRQELLPLHDFRTSKDVAKGAAGLDVQGFTFVTHQSVLRTAEEFLAGHNAEEIYVPEVIELVKHVTGAKRAVAHNVTFRRRQPSREADTHDTPRKGDAQDQALKQLPRDRILGMYSRPNLRDWFLTPMLQFRGEKTTMANLPIIRILTTPCEACGTRSAFAGETYPPRPHLSLKQKRGVIAMWLSKRLATPVLAFG
jgi:hypothetical protein